MAEGKPQSKFDIDLATGWFAENSLRNLMKMDGATVEVKNDSLCRKIGNVSVEFSQHGRPSGIATSTAKYWAFHYHDDCWLIVPTERLRQIVAELPRISKGSVRAGGDDKAFDQVIIPIQRLVCSWGDVP